MHVEQNQLFFVYRRMNPTANYLLLGKQAQPVPVLSPMMAGVAAAVFRSKILKPSEALPPSEEITDKLRDNYSYLLPDSRTFSVYRKRNQSIFLPNTSEDVVKCTIIAEVIRRDILRREGVNDMGRPVPGLNLLTKHWNFIGVERDACDHTQFYIIDFDRFKAMCNSDNCKSLECPPIIGEPRECGDRCVSCAAIAARAIYVDIKVDASVDESTYRSFWIREDFYKKLNAKYFLEIA